MLSQCIKAAIKNSQCIRYSALKPEVYLQPSDIYATSGSRQTELGLPTSSRKQRSR